jgi:hypothetical protein
MRVKLTSILCVSLCLAACGGGQKPAEEPAAESSAESSKDSSDSGDSESDKSAESKSDDAADKKDDAKEAKKDKGEKKDDSSASDTSGPKVTRTPRDILTAPDVIFMFSFNQSDMKDAAEKRCDSEVKDNPKKRADCMTKEKKKIEADGIAFKQEKGNWYWLTIQRKGKTLVNLHMVPIEFGKEDDHSIVLKPVGKDEGKLRGGAPGETKVEVPNEYEIVIQDPKLGKMVYEAKIGLTDK